MMDHGVTTPFGRRSMTLGMLASQMEASEIPPDTAADKWKLFRALCEARSAFGVSDRALSVLNALLSFHPQPLLEEGQGLVVFPSNAQLSVRAHGMAAATLRRHLADLVQAGLIIRRDSPNGKRYARKDAEGGIAQAFGFSLAPLLARADEIEAAAEDIRAAQQRMRITRERISLCRRDIAKLIEAGLEEGISADWQGFSAQSCSQVSALGRKAGQADLDAGLEELETLRAEILNELEKRLKSRKTSANESQTGRHIQNSNPHSISEPEPRFETKQAAPWMIGQSPSAYAAGEAEPGQKERCEIEDGREGAAPERLRPFPLGMVLRACPEIAMYGPGGEIRHWRELMQAAVVVRSMLGISASAYQDACEVLGPENAATVVACILERAGHINSAGGYLRDLTRRGERGEFALGPMIMALARANAAPRRVAS
jgi:replication initiation protein RepC